SSKPTHTAQTRFGVYPANQPSRDVPVFPAKTDFKPRARTFAAVPRFTTSFMNDVITYATSGRSTSLFCAVGAAIVTPSPVVMRLIAMGVVRLPKLAKAVYAEAI